MEPELVQWNQQRLEEMISNGAEESVYLDFKAAGALSNDKKKDICKDVSAFANSDGGVIIYGINEVNHKADSLSFIDGKLIAKEWLEQVINDGIQRRINGIRISPIRFGNDVTKTIYVVEIPTSPLAPHMTKDNRYYKRFNFMSVPMEEYEVRHTFERKQNFKLEITDTLIEITNHKTWFRDEEFRFLLSFHVKNIGHSVADSYKFKVSVKGANGCSFSFNDQSYNVTKDMLNDVSISTTNSFPIYSNEEVCILQINLALPFHFRKQVTANIKMDLTLFMQNSTDTESFSPGDFINKMIDRTTKKVEETQE